MSHDITLGAAAALTSAFRTEFPGREIAQSFPREVFEALLADKNVEGIKMYNGVDTAGKHHLILVGYKQTTGYDTADELSIIKQYSVEYPPATTAPNDLNS
jgi:hypothetical protein